MTVLHLGTILHLNVLIITCEMTEYNDRVFMKQSRNNSPYVNEHALDHTVSYC